MAFKIRAYKQAFASIESKATAAKSLMEQGKGQEAVLARLIEIQKIAKLYSEAGD